MSKILRHRNNYKYAAAHRAQKIAALAESKKSKQPDAPEPAPDAAAEETELAQLATAINAEHAAVESTLRASLAHALRCGELLMAAKKLVAHGEWLPWLAANCAVSKRTVQAYMRLASHRAELEAKSADHCAFDLSIDEGLKLLAEPTQDAQYIPPQGCLLRGRHRDTHSSTMVDIAPAEDRPGYCFVARVDGDDIGGDGFRHPVPDELILSALERLRVDTSLYDWEAVPYPPWPSNIHTLWFDGSAALSRWGKILNLDFSISDQQIAEWQQLAELSDEEFGEAIAQPGIPSAAGVLNYCAGQAWPSKEG